MQDKGADSEPTDGERWEHYVIPVHIWQQPSHVERFRRLRALSPDDDIREAVATYVGEIVEGEGELNRIWVAEVH